MKMVEGWSGETPERRDMAEYDGTPLIEAKPEALPHGTHGRPATLQEVLDFYAQKLAADTKLTITDVEIGIAGYHFMQACPKFELRLERVGLEPEVIDSSVNVRNMLSVSYAQQAITAFVIEKPLGPNSLPGRYTSLRCNKPLINVDSYTDVDIKKMDGDESSLVAYYEIPKPVVFLLLFLAPDFCKKNAQYIKLYNGSSYSFHEKDYNLANKKAWKEFDNEYAAFCEKHRDALRKLVHDGFELTLEKTEPPTATDEAVTAKTEEIRDERQGEENTRTARIAAIKAKLALARKEIDAGVDGLRGKLKDAPHKMTVINQFGADVIELVGEMADTVALGQHESEDASMTLLKALAMVAQMQTEYDQEKLGGGAIALFKNGQNELATWQPSFWQRTFGSVEQAREIKKQEIAARVDELVEAGRSTTSKLKGEISNALHATDDFNKASDARLAVLEEQHDIQDEHLALLEAAHSVLVSLSEDYPEDHPLHKLIKIRAGAFAENANIVRERGNSIRDYLDFEFAAIEGQGRVRAALVKSTEEVTKAVVAQNAQALNQIEIQMGPLLTSLKLAGLEAGALRDALAIHKRFKAALYPTEAPDRFALEDLRGQPLGVQLETEAQKPIPARRQAPQ